MKLNEIFSEEGSMSCMRFCVIVCLLVIIITWAIMCGILEAFVDFPIGVRWVVGILVSGKVAQKGLELVWSEDVTQNKTP